MIETNQSIPDAVKPVPANIELINADKLPVTVTLSAKNVTIGLTVITLLINAIGFAGRTAEYLLGIKETTEFVRLFHVTQEGNVTAWFSSLILLASAVLLAIVAKVVQARKQPYFWHWAFLSLIFLFMSLDETASIHELTIDPLRSLFNLSGIFRYAWVVIAIPLLVLFLVAYLRFLRDLPRTTRFLFILAGATFVAGAVGMEMASGYVVSARPGSWQAIYGILVTFEELLENIGIIIFIYALLAHLSQRLNSDPISLKFS